MSRYDKPEARQGQSRGMPRGWEHYNIEATDKQADLLLDRLCKQGPTLVTDKAPSQTENCSHSEMMFYRENNNFRMGIEFSEHLREKQSGQFARRDGGMPVYGRLFVSDKQIDSFLERFPERRPEMTSAMKDYEQGGGQYFATARPPKDAYYVKMDGQTPEGSREKNPKPLQLRMEQDGKTLEQEMKRVAPALERIGTIAENRNEQAHTMHRLIYEIQGVEGALPEGVQTRGIMDKEAVDRRLEAVFGQDAKRFDAYKVTAQVALDRPFSEDMRDIRNAQEHGKHPANAYLATYTVGKDVRHDLLVSPEIAARLLEQSRTVDYQGKKYGAIEAPVYAADHEHAMGTQRKAESIMDADTPESRSQAQNRPCVDNLTVKPPKGTVYAIDLMSGLEHPPSEPPDVHKHMQNAAILHDKFEKAQKSRDGSRAIEEAQQRGMQAQGRALPQATDDLLF